LKKNLGEKVFKELTNKNKLQTKSVKNNEKPLNDNFEDLTNEKDEQSQISNLNYVDPVANHFVELTPLNEEIDNTLQKDLSSINISEIEFPKIVYMIVESKIELQIKFLKAYTDWEFLSDKELNRKTIKIFFDLKDAKRNCHKDQKVIKVPNPDVFKIVAPILTSRGITRIVTDEKLIALDN
tara:strand:- start:203 stop:748 length:546 start_codon:yes stop_codon:yes gene_type:complete